MPNQIVITIIRKPNGQIQPEGGVRTKAPADTPIEFKAGGGATSVAVFFDGESPFGDAPENHHNVKSGTIRKKFNGAEPGKNVYVYRCELTIGGQKVSWPPPGQTGQVGGEIEIIPVP